MGIERSTSSKKCGQTQNGKGKQGRTRAKKRKKKKKNAEANGKQQSRQTTILFMSFGETFVTSFVNAFDGDSVWCEANDDGTGR